MGPMIDTGGVVLQALDLSGIFVFSISGALLAVRKGFDVIGMVVLAEITALGGGVLRDVLIGAIPPAAFRGLVEPLVPLLATALVFGWHPQFDRLDSIKRAVLIFDAAGLGVFCVTGAVKAQAYGLGPASAVVLGTCSAVGGGILRDVLANELPTVLHDRELYVVPAVIGATLVVGAHGAGWGGPTVSVLAAALAFALRLLARRLHWHAPRARTLREPGDRDPTDADRGRHPGE